MSMLQYMLNTISSWFDSREQARVENWLSESVDIADLQQRQNYLEQTSHIPWL